MQSHLKKNRIYIQIKNKFLPIQLINNKMIYWKLIDKIKINAVTKHKWIDEFGLNDDTWEKIFEIPAIIRDTKIRAFQYKLLFNLTPCNLYLYRIGKADSYACNYCPKIDHIQHFFYECPGMQTFWMSFQNWWNKMENVDITINKEAAMVGITDSEINIDQLNACLQIARWYIYTEKLNLQQPFLYKFLCLLKFKIKTEKMIHIRNNQLAKYEELWEKIELQLD